MQQLVDLLTGNKAQSMWAVLFFLIFSNAAVFSPRLHCDCSSVFSLVFLPQPAVTIGNWGWTGNLAYKLAFAWWAYALGQLVNIIFFLFVVIIMQLTGVNAP